MLIIKKLVFSIPFLLAFYFFSFELNFFFKDIYLIFGLNFETLFQLIYLILSLLFSCFFFVVFAGLADDWKLVLPIAVVASFSPIIFFSIPLSFILSAGFLGCFILEFVLLSQKLKTYLTFQANQIFNPSIKNLASFLIIITSLAFYLSANLEIQNKGFAVPDSVLDAALKIAAPQTPEVQGVSIAQLPSLTSEQLQFLKNNPDLVKQAGFDPNLLNSVPAVSPSEKANSTTESTKTAAPSSNGFVKKLVQSQIQNFIQPYLWAIPAALTLIFFVTFSSLFGLSSILLPLLTGGLFWILAKSRFIHFEVETREVKKMVV